MSSFDFTISAVDVFIFIASEMVFALMTNLLLFFNKHRKEKPSDK